MATPTLGWDNFYSTTLSAGITSADTTIPVVSAPTATEGYLVIEPDSSTNREIIYYTGVSGSNVTLTSIAGRGVGGTSARAHSSGVIVKMNTVAEMFEVLQNASAMALLMLDGNGNEKLELAATASAVNYAKIGNSATGNAVTIEAKGDDTNVKLSLNSKGTEPVNINGARPWLFLGSASATSDQGSITTIVDLTSLSVTVTVPAGATTVRIRGYVRCTNATADAYNEVYIFESSTQLGQAAANSRSGTVVECVQPQYIGTASAGSHTYKLQGLGNGGTMTARASATAPNYITVECC